MVRQRKPEAVTAIRLVLFPLLVLTGLCHWKRHAVKWWISSKSTNQME